jgi:hypothetical protein
MNLRTPLILYAVLLAILALLVYSCVYVADAHAATRSVSVPCSANLANAVNGQYTYSWKTEKVWKGTCRELNLRLKDGTDHKALFQFTR